MAVWFAFLTWWLYIELSSQLGGLPAAKKACLMENCSVFWLVGHILMRIKGGGEDAICWIIIQKVSQMVSFYKETLSTICSGSFCTALTSNIMSLSGHVSQFCLEYMVAKNASFSPRSACGIGLLPSVKKRWQ